MARPTSPAQAKALALHKMFLDKLSSLPSLAPPFSILHTIPPNTKPTFSPSSKLFILDSSFNPPTTAHASMCLSALSSSPSSVLLLLLSTTNADKPPLSASMTATRLSLMSALGSSLRSRLPSVPPDVLIGISPFPYFHSKSAALAESEYFCGVPELTQVWLLGADTLWRLFAPKYYSDESPPLKVLEGFMRRVVVRVETRVGAGGDKGEIEAWKGRLASGEMENVGGLKEWGKRIEIAEKDESWWPVAEGISSSAARKAVEEGDWDGVSRMMPEEVLQYVRASSLYRPSSKQ